VVSGVGGIVPSGSLTYAFYTNRACTGTASTTDAVKVTGQTAPKSASTAALSAGSYSFSAEYSGDANYSPSSSSCVTFKVG
jgi:hypothetical protein